MLARAENSGQSGYHLTAVPVDPNYPGDPRGMELIPTSCGSSGCTVAPSIIPTYLANPGATHGAARSRAWQTAGAVFDSGAAALDLFVTSVSASFVGAQGVSLMLAGPGLDDAAIATAYYAADTFIENPFSWMAAGLVFAGDFASGESDLNSNRLVIGQDTSQVFITASLGGVAGRVPFAGPTLDTAVNLTVNVYDIGRLSGHIPTVGEIRFDATGPHIILYR